MRHSILFDLLLHIFQHRDIRTCFLSLTPFFQILPCFRILKDTVESQSPEKPDAFFHKFPVIICRTVKIAKPDIDVRFSCFFVYYHTLLQILPAIIAVHSAHSNLSFTVSVHMEPVVTGPPVRTVTARRVFETPGSLCFSNHTVYFSFTKCGI